MVSEKVSETVSEKFGTEKKVPKSVSKIFGTGKKYQYRYCLTFWVPSHTGEDYAKQQCLFLNKANLCACELMVSVTLHLTLHLT